MMRKTQLCENPFCRRKFEVTSSNVEKRHIVRGYKYDYYAYIVKCPICGEEKEVSFFQLPLKVGLRMMTT